jgi:RNA methyltransferase, TrmH family
MKISSTSNPKIKELLIIRRRKNRTGDARFIIEGEHLVEMALRAGIFFHEIFFTELFCNKEKGRKILEQVSLKEVKAYEITDHVLRRISDTETPQGIIAVVLPGKISIEDLKFPENALIVLADGIREPGNLGALIRTADAAGVHAVVILPGTCDLFNQKTIRATAGSLFNIPIVHSDIDKLLDWLRRREISLAITEACGGTPVFAADLDKAVAFAFGNEARGIREELKAAADISLRIPIYGKAESLNVAAAAAVLLYEAARQRRLVNSGNN